MHVKKKRDIALGMGLLFIFHNVLCEVICLQARIMVNSLSLLIKQKQQDSGPGMGLRCNYHYFIMLLLSCVESFLLRVTQV